MKKLALCDTLNALPTSYEHVTFFWRCDDWVLNIIDDFTMNTFDTVGVEEATYGETNYGTVDIVTDGTRNVLKFTGSGVAIKNTVSMYNAFKMSSSQMRFGCWMKREITGNPLTSISLFKTSTGIVSVDFVYETGVILSVDTKRFNLIFTNGETVSNTVWDYELDSEYNFIEMAYYVNANSIFCSLYINGVQIGSTNTVSFLLLESVFDDFSCIVNSLTTSLDNIYFYNFVLSQNPNVSLYDIGSSTVASQTVNKNDAPALTNLVLFSRCMTEAFVTGDYFSIPDSSWNFVLENPITVGAGNNAATGHTSGWKWEHAGGNTVNAGLNGSTINFEEGRIGFWFKVENMVSDRNIFSFVKAAGYDSYLYHIGYNEDNVFYFWVDIVINGPDPDFEAIYELFEYPMTDYSFVEVSWYFLDRNNVELTFTIDSIPVYKGVLEAPNLLTNIDMIAFAAAASLANGNNIFYYDNIMISNSYYHNLYDYRNATESPREMIENALVWYWRCDNDEETYPTLVWDTDNGDFGDATKEAWVNWSDSEGAYTPGIVGNGNLRFINYNNNDDKSISFTLNELISINNGSLGFWFVDSIYFTYLLSCMGEFSIKLSNSGDATVSLEFFVKNGYWKYGMGLLYWDVIIEYKQTIGTPFTNIYTSFFSGSSSNNHFLNFVWKPGNLNTLGFSFYVDNITQTINSIGVENPYVEEFFYDTITLKYNPTNSIALNAANAYIDNIILTKDHINLYPYAMSNVYPSIAMTTSSGLTGYDLFSIPLAISRFNSSLSDITINNNVCYFNSAIGFTEDLIINENILTSKSGKRSIYTKSKSKKWKIPINYLPVRDVDIINRWREYNKELYFVPDTSKNVYYKVKITNGDNPFGKMIEGHYWNNYYEGELLLEEISST